MRKRILSILLTLCMVLCLMPTAAMAVDDTAIPKDEDGTYLIYTVEQLKIFRDRVNIDERGAINVKLMADIDLNGSEDNQWTPIGNAGLPSAYCGTFDGNGHTIKGLYINSDNEYKVGLFGYTVYPAVIHNLTVDGYVKGKDAVGGIVGHAYDTNISNCYNTGTISGNNYVGGIAGVVDSTAISSCYNIGTVNSNNYVGGIAGATSSANISNCYYLTGTANNGGGGEAKSKEEFANGTVLELLKGDRTDSPWADECKYVAAAGMTLPVFKGQGDSHAHSEKTGNCLDGIYCECGYLMHRATSEHNWGAWTSNGNDTHSHRCQNAGCTASETDNCSGGTATCKEPAACDVCHENYGEKNANNHTDATEWVQTATTHTQKYKCCGAIVVAEENHEWASGVCSECHYACGHSGGTATCTDKAVCEICGEKYGEFNHDNHTDTKEWIRTETKHTQNYKCCNKVVVAEEPHEWENGVCTECGYECSHKGGTATCTEKAVCVICGEKYGELNPDNHTDTKEWIQTETKHTQNYKCCNKVVVAEEPHEWENGVCTECGYKCSHKGGTATCTEQATCEICGEKYGEFNHDNHTDTKEWIRTETKHTQKYKCCNKVVVAEEPHEWENGVCTECGYECSHKGGTASCTEQATCEICGEKYGELNPDNHTDLKHIPEKAATKTAEGNIEYWHCDGCDNYFSDAKASKKITKADTVTAKLADAKSDNKPDYGKSPKTGDKLNLALCIALMLIIGGATIAATVVGKKKKRNEK